MDVSVELVGLLCVFMYIFNLNCLPCLHYCAAYFYYFTMSLRDFPKLVHIDLLYF